MPTIAVGGLAPAIGKTTTVVHLAEQLGALGAHVLIVDLSPDRDATAAVARTRTVDLEQVMRRELPLDTCLGSTVLAGVDLLTLPHTPLTKLFAAEEDRAKLRDLLQQAAQDYGYILLDLPPVADPLVRLALGAADAVLVPVPLEDESLEDLPRTMELIGQVRAESNPSLRTFVVLTLADAHPEAHRVEAILRQTYPDLLVSTRIPTDESLNQLMDGEEHSGVPSVGVESYHRLAMELAPRVTSLVMSRS